MGKRIGYDFSWNEDDSLKKCTTCKHAYTKQNESDVLYCARKKCCVKEAEQALAKMKGVWWMIRGYIEGYGRFHTYEGCKKIIEKMKKDGLLKWVTLDLSVKRK